MDREPPTPPAARSRDRPAPPRAPARRRVALALSVLLHAAVLAGLLLVRPRPEPDGAGVEPSYEMVFADAPREEPERSPPTPTEAPDPDATEPVPDLAAPPGTPPEPEAAPEPPPAPVAPEPPAPAAPASELPPTAPPDPAAEPVPPPRPKGPPQVRFAAPLLDLPPVPVPVPPAPAPPPPRPPTPRPQRRAGTLDAPMDLDFGPAPRRRPPPGSAASRAFDLSLDMTKPRPPKLGAHADARVANAVGDWLDSAVAVLQRRGYYPRAAGLQGEDGTAVARLLIDRSGKVLSVELVQRTGFALLDAASLAAVRGAKLPPPPAELQGETFTWDIPINYVLIR